MDHLAKTNLPVTNFSFRESLKIIFPALLGVVLFIVAVFLIVLPAARHNLLEQKKQMLAMLVETVLNLLDSYEEEIQAGILSEEQARQMAIKQIRHLRYGKQSKDYFWINDQQPRMVMHPYRQDLDGKNIADFSDPAGKHLFKEFVQVVVQQESGYVPYLWQWQDDSSRIVPKLSFVKLYKPWGWIVGTGVYLDDVQQEIASFSNKLIGISIFILIVITFLAIHIVRNGISEKRNRRMAEEQVIHYQLHLEELVDIRTKELEKALHNVQTLKGLLPICSACKKIRDDKGYWNQIESYISKHSGAEFTHGICPSCAQQLYPGYYRPEMLAQKNPPDQC